MVDESLDRFEIKTVRDFTAWRSIFMPRFYRLEKRVEDMQQYDPMEMRRQLDRLSTTVFGEYGQRAGMGQDLSDLKRWRDEDALEAFKIVKAAEQDLQDFRRMRTTLRWMLATAGGAMIVTLVTAGLTWMMRPSAEIAELKQEQAVKQQQVETLEQRQTRQEQKDKQIEGVLQKLYDRLYQGEGLR